jgi:hypothetical protein
LTPTNHDGREPVHVRVEAAERPEGGERARGRGPPRHRNELMLVRID